MGYGAILGQSSGGKRVCRLVVGTSTSGWTTSDCDYLCDGTADDVEINAAIQALPSTGGEIVILDGTYNITATIAMNKDNTKLSGNGAATILKRMWDSPYQEGVITIDATNGGCCVESLRIDGNETTYIGSSNYGIYLEDNTVNSTIKGNICDNNSVGIHISNGCSNNIITGNICNNNDGESIRIDQSSNNIVTGNTCNNNDTGILVNNGSYNNTIAGNTCNNNSVSYYACICLDTSNNNTVTGNTCNNGEYGIRIDQSSNNAVTGNTCNDNNSSGIYLFRSDNNTITGNTCIRGTGQSSDYTSSQYTIRLSGNTNNYNLIADNNIMGKNYVSGGGTSNTFVNNKFE